MAVTTALVAVAAGATVAASQAQKKGAAAAGKAFKNVGRGIEKMDKMESSMRQLLGVSKADENTDKDFYNILRDRSVQIVKDQMEGKLSEPTRAMLGRRALETGAPGLGPTAVQDTMTGYLGMTTEDLSNQGFANYRAMFGQLASVAGQQQAQNYNMQHNAASAKANSIMGQANATAGMWQGIASIAGAAAGMGGGGGGQGAGGMFGAGTLPSGGAQPSGAYYTGMAQQGRDPNAGGRYLGF